MAKAKKPRKQYPKTDAGKAERFKDFATARVNRALKAIRAVSKLANRASYSSTAEQVAKINAALKAECDRCAAAFQGRNASEDQFTV